MSECVADHGCITCGDAAIPMRVVEIDRARGLALCEAAGGQRESVEVALVDAVGAGDWLLVHAGTALARAAVPMPQPGTEPPRARAAARQDAAARSAAACEEAPA